MKKIIISILVISFILSGCGSNNVSKYAEAIDMSYAQDSVGTEYYDAEYNEEITPEYNTDEQTKQESQIQYQEKLVYTCNIDLETLNYLDTVNSIKEKIKQYEGIIESESEIDNDYDWYYSDYQKTSGTLNNYITIRIPSESYYEFLSSLDGEGKIVSKSSNVENISKQYYDTENIIKSLKIQEERLLEMMEQCSTIEEMITVESRLTEVQTQINSYNNDLSYMDTNVNYSTININIKEVVEYDEMLAPKKTNTFIDRLINTIKDSCLSFLEILEWLLFFIIRMIPLLIIFIPIGILLRKIFKKIINKRKIKKDNKIKTTEN